MLNRTEPERKAATSGGKSNLSTEKAQDRDIE
jgi:hypothetical protein